MCVWPLAKHTLPHCRAKIHSQTPTKNRGRLCGQRIKGFLFCTGVAHVSFSSLRVCPMERSGRSVQWRGRGSGSFPIEDGEQLGPSGGHTAPTRLCSASPGVTVPPRPQRDTQGDTGGIQAGWPGNSTMSSAFPLRDPSALPERCPSRSAPGPLNGLRAFASVPHRMRFPSGMPGRPRR